jgi:hypothetical protein
MFMRFRPLDKNAPNVTTRVGRPQDTSCCLPVAARLITSTPEGKGAPLRGAVAARSGFGGNSKDSDKKLASTLILVASIVMVVIGVLAVLLGGLVYTIIDFAIAGALFFVARPKAAAGDHATAKLVMLICAAVMALLGLMALGAAGAGGRLGLLVAIAVLGSAGALVYAAMLISPGKKLF